eukprot:scaffold27610_cov63-Phaeocystis_antarctica.AAC.2
MGDTGTHGATLLVHLHDLLPAVGRLLRAHRSTSHDHAHALLFLREARHAAASRKPFGTQPKVARVTTRELNMAKKIGKVPRTRTHTDTTHPRTHTCTLSAFPAANTTTELTHKSDTRYYLTTHTGGAEQ